MSCSFVYFYCSYLKQSKYGLRTTDIAINDNSSFYTGGGTSDAYKTNVAQSTTGNIYGVYDMSGGAIEMVMGNYNDTIINAGFSSMPAAKYYDKYTIKTGKTGDATTETSGWYGDSAYFPFPRVPWFTRGGDYNLGTNAGVFYFSYSFGGYTDGASARAVVSAP
ncbi:unknown [Acholeplasma sp. CAG:878]|nr:unknown [Acholeplasma sp. CAG:878]